MSIKEVMKKASKSALRQGPLWQGPEGEGPQGGITQSMIARWLECKERFRVRTIEGWKGNDQFSKAMEYGNMWHVCEEALARCPPNSQGPAGRIPWESALAEYCLNPKKGLASKYPTQQDEVDHWYKTCKSQFPCYVDYWAKHPDVEQRTPLMQEQVFDAPYELPSGRTVRLRGKFDAVDLIKKHDRLPTGIWLGENKSKGDIDQGQIQSQLLFDLQTMTYLIALDRFREEGHLGVGGPILGVRYNVIRRPFSGGRGSIKRREGSKNVPPETKEQFYQRLINDYFKADPGYWFMRWKSEVSPADVKRFRTECLDPLLEAICWWYDCQTWKKHPNNHEDYMNLPPDFHWRHPYGVHNYVDEGYGSDVDKFIETGSTVGLTKNDNLFPELT